MIDQKSLLSLRKASDFIFFFFSFIAAAFLAQPIQEFISNQLLFILLLLLNILWYVVSGIVNTYSDYNYRSFSDQLINLSRVIIVQILFTILFLFFVKEDLFTRNFVLFYSLILTGLIYIKEYFLWKTLDKQWSRGQNLRNLLLVGINEVSLQFKDEIIERPEFGFKFIGFVDKNKKENENYLGDSSKLEAIIQEHQIKDIIYADTLDDAEYLQAVRRICDKHAVKLTLLPQIKQFSNSNIELNFLGNFPVLSFRNNRLEQLRWRIAKRIFDLSITIILLVTVLWIVYLVIGVIIKLTSKGKVLFYQDRIGRDGKIFKCYKFRTMREVGFESKNIIVPEAERITPIGRFLRKYSLDELPQFANVLKGDMSIVGPRPHAINFNDMYSDMVEEIKLRHRVKPGISGWAQVHGLRGDVFDFEENKLRTKKRIDFDNWYIENWSIKLDIQIIIETVWQIVSGRNLGT